MAIRSGVAVTHFRRLMASAIGHVSPGTGSVLLFTPPLVKTIGHMAGRSLRFSSLIPETVWKDQGGVWRHQQTPSQEALKSASRLLMASGRPVIVDQETANELTEAGIGTIQSIARKDAGQWLPL